jgi:sarcosine oxidase gamma subunit
MYRVTRLRSLLFATLLLLLNGCGGGGGGVSLAVGGTSGSGVVGGTSGSGITSGTVNGFGSVVIGGTSYLTSADDPDIDTTFVGPAAGFAEADLAPGMLVQVLWTRDDDDEPREAERISYLPELVGAVTGQLVVNSGPDTLVVANRTVEITETSVFDDAYARATAGVSALASAAELSAGDDRVEISGFVLERNSATGASVIRASRIARIGVTGAADPDETVSGIVSSSGAGSFAIADAGGGSITVTFDTAVVADDELLDGSGRLTEGARVRVTGQLSGDEFAATEIRRPLDDLQRAGDDEAEGEIQGPVTQGPGTGNAFRVAGQPVRFDGDTEFAGGTADDLEVGRQVKVEGSLEPPANGERVLLAAEIRIEQDAEVSLTDTVATAVSQPLPGGERTFETRIGLTVVIEPGTLLKDDSDDSGDGRLAVNALEVGDLVELDGYFDAAGALVAVTLERDDDEGSCELEARVRGSGIVGANRHYTIDGRPGLVVADVSGDTSELIPPGGFGEFEADGDGDCAVQPDGTDVDGVAIDAGFLAGEVEAEDDDD